MNENANVKTNKASIVKNVLFLAIYTLLMIGATASMLESSGILRTIPFVFILPAAATLFYNKKRLTCALVFVFVLFFALIETGSEKTAFLLALTALAFAFVGIFIKRLVVTFFVDNSKKAITALLSVVLFAASIVLYAFLFGNPFSAISAQNENLSYINESYGQSAPDVRYTYYDFEEKAYMTKVAFSEDAVMSADICAKDPENVIDGYNNFYEHKYLTARSNILTSLFELEIPDETRLVRINIEDTKITGAAIKDPDALCAEMVFDVAFYSQLNTKEEFLSKCREYYDVILDGGFVFGKICFYGGFADDFLFEMTVEYGKENDLASLVKDFSAETFERYYDDKDLYDHWSYND